MSKRIFSPNQHRRESGLGRIVLGLLVSVAAIYAVIAGVSYLRSGGEAAPDAPEVMTESGGSSAPATSSSAAAPSEPVAGKHPKLAEAEAALGNATASAEARRRSRIEWIGGDMDLKLA